MSIIKDFTLDKTNIYINNTTHILNVEPSKIKLAGNGIFTYKDIPKETLVGYYDGILKKFSKECVGDYSFSLSKTYYLDASSFPRSYIAMINDAHGSKFKNNCEFRMELKDKNGKKHKCNERKIYLYTLRKIKLGEELYASYGKEYWGSRL